MIPTLIVAAACVVAAAAVLAAIGYRLRWRAALRRLDAAHIRHCARIAGWRAEVAQRDAAVVRLVERCARLQQHVNAVDADVPPLPTPEDVDAEIWADIVQHYDETADEPRRQP